MTQPATYTTGGHTDRPNHGPRVHHYRRSETRWAAGRLYDRLAEVIGREHLFFDVSDIEPGEDFVQRIREIVGACDVLSSSP